MVAVHQTLMNKKAIYDPKDMDIKLSNEHKPVLTLNQLQQLVRQATVEHALSPNKAYSYHLFEKLYEFNRKAAIEFLMVGVGDTFFDSPKELVLSLVGKYFLGDLIKNEKYRN